MKPENASEFFSGYYENQLEPSVRAQFERLIEENAEVALDYAAFAATIEDIEATKETEIEVPHDLHELIMRRVDRSIYESKNRQKVSWRDQWRMWVLGSAVTGALVLSVVAAKSGGSAFMAGILPAPANNSVAVATTKIEVVNPNGVTVVRCEATRDDNLEILRASDGFLLQNRTLKAGETVEFPLTNASTSPVLVEIMSKSGSRKFMVAVPGTQPGTVREGKGSLSELALAMAASYGKPVLLETTELERAASWKLADEPLDSVVEDARVTMSMKESVIVIRD